MNIKRLAVVVATALAAVGPAAARTAHYGGTLTLGTASSPSSLDPTQSNGSGIRRLLPAYCLSLYTYASNHGTLELDPILAAAPPTHSADKLTYTIQLRKGIEFNDGTPFNAQAVVSSFQRYTTYPGSVRASDFVGVDRATATGPYTVAYHLTQRNSAFTGNLYPLSPTAVAKEGAGFGSDPICVGPFMVDSWTPGVQTTLVKSPYYYKRGAVYLDKIVFKILADTQAELAALQAGDIQAMYDSVGDAADEPEHDGDQGFPARLGGPRDQHREQERRREPALLERRHPARAEPEAPAGVRGGDRPEHGLQGRLERRQEAELHTDPVRRQRVVRADQGALHALRPKGRKAARGGIRLPDPDHRSPPDRHRQHRGRSGGTGHPVRGGRGRVQRRHRPPRPAAYGAALQSGHFDVGAVTQSPTDPDPNSYIYPFFDTAGR